MEQIIGYQEDNILEDTLENDILDETVTPTASLTAASPLKLSDIALDTNTGGFVINGEAAGDYSGWSVSGAGDINGDGLADLIVGSARGLFLGDVSKSYVVFGKTNGGAVNLSDVATGIGGFTINGEAAGDYSGWSVSGAGDVNGDGLADLIVGAWGSNSNGKQSGKSYVVFGKTDGTEVNLSNVTSGIGGFTLNAEAQEDALGFSVSDAGDVNGDGFDDLIVDSPGAGQFGKSYVVFGKADINSVQLSEVAAGIGGFAINNQTEGDAAIVSSAGDVNGDGLDDLILGAPNANANGKESGKSYVVFGKTDGTTVNLNEVTAGVGGFAINGEAAFDNAGFSVSAAGDVNGDGLSDLIVGADGADPNGKDSGKSYVIFGKTDATSVNLSDVAAGNGGFVINGAAQLNISGGSVSSAGDINADGLDDLIIGTNPITAIGVLAAIAGPQPVPTFKSYVVFGKTDNTAVELSDVAAGIGGFALEKDYISSDVVSDAGDVNGDGFDDVIIGNPFADRSKNIQESNSAKGKSYVVYGGDFTGTVTQQGGTDHDLLTGTAAPDVIVAGEGNDILIGNGDKDILYAGVGDDLIGISDLNFNRIKGGNGIDTLRLDSNGMFLDLKAIANNRITGIEQIDLNNSGSNALAFNKLDVLAMSDTKELVILGNTGDLVVSIGQGWTASGTQLLDNNLYNKYAVGGVSLLVDSDISQLIS